MLHSTALFLPLYVCVRSFLYLFYTLAKLYYTKALAIKPPHWPQIEFFSSGGHEPQCHFWFSSNLSSWGLVRDPSGQRKDAWSSSSLFS